MRVPIITLLFTALVGVKCEPDLNIFGFEIPTPKIGTDENSLEINLTIQKDGIEVSKHEESYYENSESSETHTESKNETYSDTGDLSSLSQDNNSTDTFQEYNKSQKKTEDTGLKLGKSGLTLFTKKNQNDDQSTTDQETGSTSSVNKANTTDSSHSEESGSTYNKTLQTRDHQEKSEESSFTLGGSGLFATKKTTAESETHDVTKHEDGSSWNRTQDYSKDGDTVRVAASNQTSSYANDEKKSSAKNSTETETSSGQAEQGSTSG